MISLVLAATLLKPVDYSKDFLDLWTTIRDQSAFLKEDKIDWNAVRQYYEPKFQKATSHEEFMDLLEKVMGEMRDFHASLGTNNQASPRLVPSGTDLYATWVDGKAVIEQVREESQAQLAKILPGDIVVTLNGADIRASSQSWLGKAQKNNSARAWEWGLNSALAGRWNEKRVLTLQRKGKTYSVTLDTFQPAEHPTLITKRWLDNHVLYVRPEDSLGKNVLITAFDEMLPDLRKAKGVILDLRNTPSGGTTSVARGIMGDFISKRAAYQRHVVEEPETATVRDWVEYATPRTNQPCTAPLIVLVNRWTGSMGEGLAIGFDGMHRATVIGTKMAGLRGAIDSFEMPESHIRFFFPTEKIYHVNGTLRHEWKPAVEVTPGANDPWMAEAIKRLK